MFAYHPVGAYPFFHVDLGVWFLGYLSHWLVFPRCHIGAYLFSFWVAYSPSPLPALRHRVQIPYRSDGSPAWCLDPLSFQRFSDIMSGSPIISAALRHRVRIPLSFRQLSHIMSESPIISIALWHHVRILFHFDSSLASCLDPLSFWRFSGIVSGSFIFSAALQHCVIPFLFSGSLTSCSSALSFPLLFGIVFGSPFFWWLSDIVFGYLFFSVALRHCVRIPYLFDRASASCLNPLSFWQLSNIVSGSPFFSTTLRHSIRIP